MKFLADMGISPHVVGWLRTNGHDAVHLHQLGLDRMIDKEVLQKALQEDRVLITHDLDFGELLAASGENLPSVIIFRLKDMRAANINRYLSGILTKHSQALEHGVICSVTERKVRLRYLPI
jgi:predicted nuclease of predicted toxin-antitoxin system